MAYDRLLERLHLVDQRWIVKGATALLAREIGARGTIDVDVQGDAAAEVAEHELRQAASESIGDWFRFDVGPRRPCGMPQADAPTRDCLHRRDSMASFRVDLVGSDATMTVRPTQVPRLSGESDVVQSPGDGPIARRYVRTASTRRWSSSVAGRSSLVKIDEMCFSTALGVTKSSRAIAELVRP